MNQPYFTFNQNGLEVQFNNLSVTDTTIDSLEWDFGDGNTSTDENPVHTYPSAGFFNVKLTLTIDAETHEITLRVSVNELGKPIPNNLPIILLVKQSMPPSLVVDNDSLVNTIRNQQDYLYPLVVNPPAPSLKYNELEWQSLENVLISKLVLIELIINGANSYLLSQSKNNDGASRTIKKITTGPAETEWFSDSDVWKGIMSEGGILEGIKKSACVLADRLRIFLPFCPVVNKVITPKNIKVQKSLDLSNNFFKTYKN